MRTPLVAGNWKMHGDRQMVRELLAGIQSGNLSSGVDVAVFPPYVYLPQVAEAVAGSAIAFGAQTLSEHQQGAFTGEISASMLVDIGCQYVLVGHSERRTLFAESNEQVAEKFVAAQKAGLIPMLCVGETLEEREAGKTLSVISEQLQAVTARDIDLTKSVIAYEPVWAIGTGLTATPEQAQEVHAYIREQLGAVGQQVRILYGGSVKADNAASLFAEADIDGALVGGASLKADQFCEICRAAVN